MRSHDYEQFAGDYAKLDIANTYYLAFRDIPGIVKKYVRGKKALDYGCGGGRSTRFLKNLGLNVVGVDISRDMIEEARKRDPTGEYHLIKSGELPFDDNSFDFLFSTSVFVEIPSLEEMVKILSEMKRVLKDGATATIVTLRAEAYNRNWSSFNCDFPENKNLKSGEKAKLKIHGTGITLHDYAWSDLDYRKAFSEAGLNLVEEQQPLATRDEPYKWVLETEFAPWSVYVLRK